MQSEMSMTPEEIVGHVLSGHHVTLAHDGYGVVRVFCQRQDCDLNKGQQRPPVVRR